MTPKVLGKFILIILIVGWCYLSLTPLQDRDFAEFIESKVTSNHDKFDEVLKEADELTVSTDKNLFIALRDLGRQKEIDYHEFFPDINLGSVPNQDKRNATLLKYLLSESKSNL